MFAERRSKKGVRAYLLRVKLCSFQLTKPGEAMGGTFSDCYESPDSNHDPPPTNHDTGRSDLHHASWDPSEAGKYHTDSSQRADPEYDAAAADESLNPSDGDIDGDNSRKQIHSGDTASK